MRLLMAKQHQERSQTNARFSFDRNSKERLNLQTKPLLLVKGKPGTITKNNTESLK